MELSPGKLWGMRRMADAGGRFKMVAVDQRPPIKNPIRETRGTAEAPFEDVAAFKLMLVEELQADGSAMLLDPHFARPGGLTLLSPARGRIVTPEDSIFRETEGGRLSAEIDNWSVDEYMRELNALIDQAASPWFAPPAYEKIGIDAHAGAFRHHDGGFA
jgi:tagatose 1,6-diphosphate aldolase